MAVSYLSYFPALRQAFVCYALPVAIYLTGIMGSISGLGSLFLMAIGDFVVDLASPMS